MLKSVGFLCLILETVYLWIILFERRMEEKKHILLTGASGNIGREVLAQLFEKRDQYRITIFDKMSNKARSVFAKYKGVIRVIEGDISFYDQIEKASFQVDVVIHLAAIIPPLADDKPNLAERVNVQGTKNLIKALEKNSPNAFLLYSSSVAVYGDRLANPDIRVGDILKASKGDTYAITKITAESIIQESKLNWSIFRLAAIIGVKNHEMSKIMFHMPLETMIEICSPRDTARAFVHAIVKTEQLKARIFNLGGGADFRIRYRDFLEMNFELYGLGKFNFPDKAFAQKNFHCGNYVDGDDLEQILQFRTGDIESYKRDLQEAISPIQLWLTKLVAPIVKNRILKLSEPLQAIKNNDTELLERFF